MANSYVEYTSLSGTTYATPDYLNINDINVKGYNGSTWTTLTISSRDASAKTITLSAAPSSYQKIRVYRSTTADPIVDFVDGALLTANHLDSAYQQGLFVAQEVSEDAGAVGSTSTTNLSLSGTTSVDNLTATGIVQIPSGTDANHFYREGTWTPSLHQLGTAGSTITNAKYTKIGRVVHIYVDINFVTNSDTSPIQITNLPYSGNNNMNQTLPTPFSTNYTGSTLIPLIQDTVIYFRHTSDATYQDVSGKFLRISGSYQIL